MRVNRSSYYNWLNNISKPNAKKLKRQQDIDLFIKYHNRYPTHGYRFINHLIQNKEGLIVSDNYALHCWRAAGLKAVSEKIKPKFNAHREYTYPNYLAKLCKIDSPMEVIVTDMTMLRINGELVEVTIYMDLFNNEVIFFDYSFKRGDTRPYLAGKDKLIDYQKEHPELKMILHSDQGFVYSSKSFNELFPLYNITHSMSRAAHPTDNAHMEAIIGWIKDEIYTDFGLSTCKDVGKALEDYFNFYNKVRPACALGYLTPEQYRLRWEQDKKPRILKKDYSNKQK